MDEDTGHTPPSAPDALPAPTLDDARRALRDYFGYEDFRLGQKSVIEAILAGRDALAVMPTGAGKSLCYQIPSIVLPGVAIVVSPLVSLMGDQVRALVQAGVHAAYLNSVPRFFSVCTLIVPPIISTMFRVMAMPRPVPCMRLTVEVRSRSNGSKMRASSILRAAHA